MTKRRFINPWAPDAEEVLQGRQEKPPPTPDLSALEDDFHKQPVGVHVIAEGYGGFVSSQDATAGEALARLAKACARNAAVVKVLGDYAVTLTVGVDRPADGFFVYDAPSRTLLAVQGVPDRQGALLQITQGLLALARDPYLAPLLHSAGITPYRK